MYVVSDPEFQAGGAGVGVGVGVGTEWVEQDLSLLGWPLMVTAYMKLSVTLAAQ